MDPRVKKIADQARQKRAEAMQRGDYAEAQRWDAAERQALRQDEGGAEPVVGSGGRTV